MVVRLRTAGTFACVIALLAMVTVSPAHAAPATPFALSGAFSGSSSLIHPQALAVDQSTGDIYVIDNGNFGSGATIHKFNSAGSPEPFSASQSYIRVSELVGTPQNSFNFSFNSPTAGIAVDNSVGAFHGDIYVTDGLNAVIDVFGPSGLYLGQLSGSGTPQATFLPCGVSVDSTGRVYVGDIDGYIERYTPAATTFPITDADYAVSEISGVGGVCSIATDSSGDVFASTFSAGPLNEYDTSQFPVTGSSVATATEIDPLSTAVAVDPINGMVFSDEGSQISSFDITGGVPTLMEHFGSLSGASQGLAAYHPNGGVPILYASDEGTSPDPVVDAFSPASPRRPSVTATSVTEVTSDSADLNAALNPNFADTTYHFEYGTTDSYGGQTPGSDGGAGSGGGLNAIATVTLHIQGLQPNTHYHYRVVATNTSGTTDGPDETFDTHLAGGPYALPDGRAWEMVSPLDKNRSLLTGIDGQPGSSFGGLVQASPDGNSIIYASNGAFAGSTSSTLAAQYLAKRSATSWSTTSLAFPVQAEAYAVLGHGGPYKAFSSDLSRGLLLNGTFLPITSPPLDASAPAGYQDLFLHDIGTDVFQPALSSAPSESPGEFELGVQSATPDLSHIIFDTTAALTPEAVGGSGPAKNLYDWSGNKSKLINLLPGQTEGTPGAVLGEDRGGIPGGLHQISNDGSVIFFSAEGNLYARVDGTNTIQVDESKEGLASGGGKFQTASTDGSRVFFIDTRQLTSDAGTHGFSELFELNLKTGALSDLTTTDPVAAEVQRVLAASNDGSYVYFVANGVLASGAVHGRCRVGIIGGGHQRCNLYVWHRSPTGNTIKFITTLSEEDNLEVPEEQEETRGSADDWAPTIHDRTSRVTPDGLHLVFMSNSSLTGYDNRDTVTGTPQQEIYDYNAAANELNCASCNPSGARPSGPANIPGGTQFEGQGAAAIYQSRIISDDADGRARIFFNSRDQLVSQDGNTTQDVYEWEEGGRGNCQNADGCIGLVSSGTSSNESAFVDASTDGRDVFFLTTTKLVKQDTDDLLDLYDARELGGFPAEPTATSCTGTGCQGIPSTPPIFSTPSSVTFNGVGNLSPPTSTHSRPKAKSAAEIRAEKLGKALKACRHQFRSQRHKRAACEAQAHKRFAAKPATRKLTKGRK